MQHSPFGKKKVNFNSTSHVISGQKCPVTSNQTLKTTTVSLGIMGTLLRASLKHHVHHIIIVLRDLRGSSNGPLLCREAPVSRTANVSFFQSGHRNAISTRQRGHFYSSFFFHPFFSSFFLFLFFYSIFIPFLFLFFIPFLFLFLFHFYSFFHSIFIPLFSYSLIGAVFPVYTFLLSN